MENNCPSYLSIRGQNEIPPPKFSISWDYSQTNAAILNKSCHPCLPEGHLSPAFKHRGFLWKRTVIVAQVPMDKIGTFPPKIWVSLRQKQSGQTALADLSLWWSPLFCPEALELHASFLVEMKHISSPGVHGQNWDSTSKSPRSKDRSFTKAVITDRCGCPWLPECWLSPAFQTHGLSAFLSIEKNRPSPPGKKS